MMKMKKLNGSVMRLVAFAISLSSTSISANEKFHEILTENCIQCHGKRKVKGNLNLVELMKFNPSPENAEEWVRVFNEVQNRTMPPEDESELYEDEIKAVLDTLKQKLGEDHRKLKRRMITPAEFKNSIEDLFLLDIKNFDPYGDLSAFVSPEYKFHTVKSHRMMNRFYLNALRRGTERIIQDHTSANQPKPGKVSNPHTLSAKQIARAKAQKDKVIARRKAMQLEIEKAATPEALRDARKRFYDSQQGILEREIARRTPKSTNYTTELAFPLKMSPKIKDTTDGFFEYQPEYWGIRGKSWIGNVRKSIMLLGGYKQQFRRLPPGQYRLTISASAVDRDAIKTVPHIQDPEKAWSNNNRLATERAKLVILKDANRTKTTSDQSTKAVPVGAFHIEDDVIRDYTIDISFNWPTQLGMLFENDVTNVIKSGKHPVMYYDDNGEIVYVKAERKLPTIRIYDVTLERTGDMPRGQLYITDLASFDDDAAREKLKTFVLLAGLDPAKAETDYLPFYQALRGAGLASFEAYKQAMTWLLVSSDYLYVDGSSKHKRARLRHASYALLKTVPSDPFKKAFESFRSKKTDARAFTDFLVSTEAFERFTYGFASQWMDLKEIDNNEPDQAKFSIYYDDHLKEDLILETVAHIQYLFTENRKLSELVSTDYHFLNDRLARLYGIPSVRSHEIKKVKARSPEADQRMGVLSHASFMIAHANGVEDLPFKRSEWISHNILDKRVPPPPNEIDVTAFGRSKEKDFASKIKAHINNAQCRDCHRLIDPMAIDLHMFDVLGQAKTQEFSFAKVAGHRENLKKIVTQSDRKLASAFTKNLLTYIKGAKPGVNDLVILEKILDETEKDGYRARDVLAAIVKYYF